MVELSASLGLVGKTTKPPGFGLVPALIRSPLAVIRPDSLGTFEREAIEFVNATPLEYLSRWLANNEVFEDDVRLASVIEWADGMVSFGITQPQYHGVPAEQREIEAYFKDAGWRRLRDPEHVVFFNDIYGVLAIDAESRNCYVSKDGLQPFDVILCKPDVSIEKHLRIYPE